MQTDLVTLRLFVAIFEERSITRAADRENIAVSAASKRLADLEQGLEVALFLRQPKGLVATRAAHILLGHAKGLLRAEQQMRKELAEHAAGEAGTIRIHATVSALEGYLSTDLPAFSRLHPQIAVEVEDGLSRDALTALRSGAADLAIVSGTPAAADLIVLPYRRQRLVAVLPGGHPLAARERLKFAEMLDFDLIGARSGSALDTVLRQAAAALGRTLTCRIRYSGYEGVARIVGAGGDTLAIAPENCMERHLAGHGVVIRPLDETWADRQLSVCLGEAGTEPATQLLAAFLTGSPVAPRPPLSLRAVG